MKNDSLNEHVLEPLNASDPTVRRRSGQGKRGTDPAILAQRCQDEQGYLVLRWKPGKNSPPKVGSVIESGTVCWGIGRTDKVPVRLACIGEGTRQEFVAQRDRYCPLAKMDYVPGELFFKVIAE